MVAPPHPLVGHGNTVFRAIYTPDGGQLATVGRDMTVRLWDLATNRPLFTLRLPDDPAHDGPWDFDLRRTPAGACSVADPLTMGRLALYRLPYRDPPESIRSGGAGRARGRSANGTASRGLAPGAPNHL